MQTEPARRPELLDRPGLPRRASDRALRDLGRINRWLFAFRPVVRTLRPRLSGARSVRLVDLGAGACELSSTLAREAAGRGSSVTTIAVDRHLAHLLYAREQGNGARLVVADALRLPFRDHTFDWSLSTLFLHHFDRTDARRLLEEKLRVARRGAVTVDLRRSRLGSWVVRLILPLMGAGSIARHDGRLSIDQAWPLTELESLTRGLPVVEIRRRFPFRFSLVLGPGPGSP